MPVSVHLFARWPVWRLCLCWGLNSISPDLEFSTKTTRPTRHKKLEFGGLVGGSEAHHSDYLVRLTLLAWLMMSSTNATLATVKLEVRLPSAYPELKMVHQVSLHGGRTMFVKFLDLSEPLLLWIVCTDLCVLKKAVILVQSKVINEIYWLELCDIYWATCWFK